MLAIFFHDRNHDFGVLERREHRPEQPTGQIHLTRDAVGEATLDRLGNAVLERFRAVHPEHELQADATRQLAHVYRVDGQTARAAAEHERIADESEDPGMRSEALLVAGGLYEQSADTERTLDVYRRYVVEFPDVGRPKKLASSGLSRARWHLPRPLTASRITC